MTADTAPPLAAGVPFGRYLIRKRLARGGMGEVFLADQVGPRGPVRPVALKRMLPRIARDPAAAQRFLDEMATAAQLNHPNIAITYDFGEIDGQYFIAMEYVEGLSLHQLLKANGPLDLVDALMIATSVADALAYAHERKAPSGKIAPVVHRDVSPHNIMVSTDGAVKLLDFGIARAEAAALGGKLEGKIAYAAPEQLQGDMADRRSDLWALGVVLYEALSGVRPFEATGPDEQIEAAMARRYEQLSLRRPQAKPLDAIIDRALEPNPDERWPNAESLRDACERQVAVLALGDVTLGGLVARAGGPVKSTIGVEHITSMNMRREAREPPTATLQFDQLGVQVADAAAALKEDRTEAPAGDLVDSSTEALIGAALPKRWDRLNAILAFAAVVLIGFSALFLSWTRADDHGDVAEQPPPPAEVTAVPAKRVVEAPTPPVPVPTEPVVVEPVAEKADPTPARLKSRTKRRARTVTSKAKPAPIEATTPATKMGPGKLAIMSRPWARVELDGRAIGATPMVGMAAPAGRHVLKLTAGTGNFPPRTVRVEVTEGAETKVVVDFAADSVRVNTP